MPDAEPDQRQRPSTLRRAIRSVGRAVGDASLTIGTAGGLRDGERGQADDLLLARSVLIGEGRRGYDDRTRGSGLLDRVPGWVFVVIVLGLMVVAYVTWGR